MNRADQTHEDLEEVRLGVMDLPDLCALSSIAGWNQVPADWRLMLGIGIGWGLRTRSRVVASTVVLPYVGFAWVSMVLVDPGFRRRGLATRLVGRALEWLDGQRMPALLDATADGEPVYRALGFVPMGAFDRWVGTAPADLSSMPGQPVPVAARIVPAVQAARAAIDALDRRAFGGVRARVLGRLLRRLPRHATVAMDERGLAQGFLLGRDGALATQFGPVVATAPGIGVELVRHALQRHRGPVCVDVPEAQTELRALLAACGFEPRRHFVRMARGIDCLPGEPALQCCVAGPELG